MTPEPMPTRLRREAARWGDSKLAELLTQAAEEMEAAERERPESVAHFVALALKEKGAREQAEAQLAASRAEGERLRGALVALWGITRQRYPGATMDNSHLPPIVLRWLENHGAALTPASPGDA